MSEKISTTTRESGLAVGQTVALASDHDSDFAGLRAVVMYAPDENNAGAVIQVSHPGHQLHGWTLDVSPNELVTGGKLVDSRYIRGVSEVDDDLSDVEWFRVMGPSEDLLQTWNRESITGGLAPDATANASVDGERVVAVYVEDDQSDEYARMFECFGYDGSVSYVPEEDIELDDDLADSDVSDDYRGDPTSCATDGVHLTSTDSDGYCNACGHQQSDGESEDA